MGYIKEAITEVRPILELIYQLMDDNEQKEVELTELRELTRKKVSELDKALEDLNTAKRENYTMQMFIEQHVPEEKKKLIFKDTSDSEK
ncbi:hypothetical protein [Priestia megaterium]|uniref:hypothetical protein n=1 Tax=Priestia megaterium TaxID=1404 RepID=UPI0023DAE281|nr:hypothetical protein [Priestia megaterium]MDF2010240.1 hypothetical protein [Priestia megaterium]